MELSPVELALLSTKPFSIEPCFADRAEEVLVEFKASIILIVKMQELLMNSLQELLLILD
jgi:hypothetical protein